jgi:hypothetical protein
MTLEQKVPSSGWTAVFQVLGARAEALEVAAACCSYLH